jgi:hypothetical protein
LNFTLNDATLCYEMRKPFDVLAKGLVSAQPRGDWTPVELFLRFCLEINGDLILRG